MTGTAATAAAGLALAPGLATAAPHRRDVPGEDRGPVGVDPYTGEPLNAGPNCDRGFPL